MTIADEIFALFDQRGCQGYFGEGVSTTEHCLQAAHYGQMAGASPALVVAALLHDVGHLVEATPDDLADWVTDAHHEEAGGRWLAQRFPAAVYEPVRLHVPAKRYLCAVDPGYCAKLSPASVVTLTLQGGAMSAAEVARFETAPYHRDAVRLRHWDDQGKVVGLSTPTLEHYRAMIDGLVLSGLPPPNGL